MGIDLRPTGLSGQSAPTKPPVLQGELLTMEPLSDKERDQLERCETQIRDGLKTFMTVGNALITIQDNRLYRATHKTFDEYTKAKFGFGRGHGYRLIDAVRATEAIAAPRSLDRQEDGAIGGAVSPDAELSPIGDTGTVTVNAAVPELVLPEPESEPVLPTSASQVRAITDLPTEQIQEVWDAAVTENGGEVPTQEQVRAMREKMYPKPAPEPKPVWVEETAQPEDAAQSTIFDLPGVADGIKPASELEQEAEKAEAVTALAETVPSPAPTPAVVSAPTPVRQVEATKPTTAGGITVLISADEDDALFEAGFDNVSQAIAELLRRIEAERSGFQFTPAAMNALRAITDHWNNENPDNSVSPSQRLEALLLREAQSLGYDTTTLKENPVE